MVDIEPEHRFNAAIHHGDSPRLLIEY